MRKLILHCVLFLLSATLTAQESGNIVIDMVHHNPGEAFTKSTFLDTSTLQQYGFTGQVINDFRFIHCAITYDTLNPDIFPSGSPERLWVNQLALHIDSLIQEAHSKNLKVYYFTDIIVLPKRLKELYASEICNSKGLIDIRRPKTQEIHRIMIREIFQRFPQLDGLVIRVGETYLHNVPYHIGNGPILQGEKYPQGEEEVHVTLMNILREEVCEKQNKTLIYRTWDFGNFHERVPYYLKVTNQVLPHPQLYISVKHPKGDYHRTLPFNPTLGIGRHQQIVEVQCQREYEGKGAYPNYVCDGVINGFEENRNKTGIKSLDELKNSPLFRGVWTWSRGGGWEGPYLKNEFWCELNTYVMANWAKDPQRKEEDVFFEFTYKNGFNHKNAKILRKIALRSADAVVRGRASLIYPINVWWTRDHFIGGVSHLKKDFDYIIANNLQQQVIAEKEQSVLIWNEIVRDARSLRCKDKDKQHYIYTSAQYGQLLYTIYCEGWKILQYGYEGEKKGVYDKQRISVAYENYNKAWQDFARLKEKYTDCASLYKPEAFWKENDGMRTWVNYYMKKIE